MLIWLQDESGFIYMDRHQCIRYLERGTGGYAIVADGTVLGVRESTKECDEIMRKIMLAFRTGQVECNPW